MKWFAFDFFFLSTTIFLDKTIFRKFLPDLYEIICGEGDIQRVLDRFEMVDFGFGFLKKFIKSFCGSF